MTIPAIQSIFQAVSACLSPSLGIGCTGGGGGGGSQGIGTQCSLLMQLFTLDGLRTEVSNTYFFDIATTQNDHPRYVKQVFGPISIFFTSFWYCLWGGGAPKALVHNLLMQFFTLDSSKIEVFKTCFFDIVTTQYDHPSYLKHVSGRIQMLFTLFGYWIRGGGAPKG